MAKLKEQQDDANFAAKNISRESASMLNLLMEQIKTLVEVSNNLNERTKEVEKRINELTVDSEKRKEESKIMNEKMDMMEKNMEKFIGLYEVVTNQYNPFLESNSGSSGTGGKEQGVEEEEETEDDVVASTVQQPEHPQPQQPVQQSTQQSPQPQMPQISENHVQQAPQQGMSQPVQQPISPQQGYQDSPQGGASFHYEDRITGERGFVGEQNQARSSPYQENAWAYGNPQTNANQYQHGAQGYQSNPQIQNQSQGPQGNMNASSFQQPDGSLLMPTQKKVNNLQDLLEELAVMDDSLFYAMVNNQANHIATWVMNYLGDMQLGAELFKCGTRVETIKMISRRLHHTMPQQQTSTEFRLSNGKVVSNVETMLDELIYIDDATFASHVNNSKNDIADWLQGSLGLNDLAQRVRGLSKKPEVVRELAMYLHSNN